MTPARGRAPAVTGGPERAPDTARTGPAQAPDRPARPEPGGSARTAPWAAGTTFPRGEWGANGVPVATGVPRSAGGRRGVSSYTLVLTVTDDFWPTSSVTVNVIW